MSERRDREHPLSPCLFFMHGKAADGFLFVKSVILIKIIILKCMPHKGDMMTVREIVETLGLAADEDAVRKWQSTMPW